MAETSIRELLTRATGHHRAGELEAARALYQAILAQWPDNADALHLFGLTCHQQGDHETAVEYIRKAVKRVPDQPVLRNNLGDALHKLGDLPAAVLELRRALELRPETVLKLLGECDAFRRPERFSEMLLACQCDAQGRTGLEEKPYPQRDYLERARATAAAVVLDEQQRAGLEGQAIAGELQRRRQAALALLRR